MKLQRLLRMPVDLAMTLALFFLMGYQLWGEAAHEWAGAAILVLLCCHHLLNLRWYGALPKGRYSPLRALSTAVNFLLLGAMLLQLGSGMVNRVHAYISPKILGGVQAKTPVGGLGFASPDEAVILKNSTVTPLGDDFLIESEAKRSVYRNH